MLKLIRKYIIFYFMFKRGITRENIGEYPDAMDYFYLALSLRPNSVKTYKAIARLSQKTKTSINGIDFLNKASWRFPEKSEFYAIKADLYRGIKDLDNAIKEYDLALSHEGDNSEYYIKRAEIKSLKGDIQGALNDYNGAIKYNSSNAQLYSQRAFFYFLKKNYSNAAQDYTKAIELNPKKAHYYYMLASVQKLLDDNESDVNFKKAEELGIKL